jgi:pimeloyl-ACP methyl ester carboxylesterase
VLMHGNPTWGYLYRNFIPPLVEAGYRVIVPDLLGAGRSDKPGGPEVYRIRRHADRTERLLESLDLRDATLVPHDWGMHSLYWAIRHPERLRGLFILNTMAHRRREQIRLPLTIRLFRNRGTGPLLVKRLDVVRRFFLFRFGIAHRERLTPTIKRAYLAPNPTAASRTGVLVFVREVPTGPSDPVSYFWGELEDGLERHFRDKPVGIAWGMKGRCLHARGPGGAVAGHLPPCEGDATGGCRPLRPGGRLRAGRPALLDHLGRDDRRGTMPDIGSARLPGRDRNVEAAEELGR